MRRAVAIAWLAALAVAAPARSQDLSNLGIELRAPGWTVTVYASSSPSSSSASSSVSTEKLSM